ncbi:hypothetical protein LSTR_LSTR012644 [Laodelphax striatellus]|uniref:Beta-galactoside alpha-2,6-sialyltransferase 1 n=1 Tax=Laodelphax striatellus TaxID=195883 RepID=A0A482XIV9_LAOST|nr:hypothetical protein LSTR_LSTR012644 [Laodelphax striatellus]
MKSVPRLRTIDGKSRPFSETGLGDSVPRVPLFGAQEHYNNCAIVSSAGSLKGSNLGPLIDSNDVVLRFNHAPTEGYDDDVGTKTTIRILNSQVVSKPEFNFLYSPMYRDIKLLAWDPSNYTSSLEQWFMNPDFDIFTPYMKHRQMNPDTNSHILDPRDLWKLWDYLQAHTPVRIRKNPPSSGFLGLVLLLPYCSYINMYEYIPTVRLTNLCHYFDDINDPSCTFGAWHPLSAEKLLALGLNRAADRAVFQTGFITIPGYQKDAC